MPPFHRNIPQKIEADGIFQIGRVKIHHIVGSPGRNLIENVFGQVAVGINDPDTMAVFNVLENEITEERCLARATLADAIDVLTTIGRKEPEWNHLSPRLPAADEVYRLAVVIHFKVIARHSRASPRSTERRLWRSGNMLATTVTVDEPPR